MDRSPNVACLWQELDFNHTQLIDFLDSENNMVYSYDAQKPYLSIARV